MLGWRKGDSSSIGINNELWLANYTGSPVTSDGWLGYNSTISRYQERISANPKIIWVFYDLRNYIITYSAMIRWYFLSSDHNNRRTIIPYIRRRHTTSTIISNQKIEILQHTNRRKYQQMQCKLWKSNTRLTIFSN